MVAPRQLQQVSNPMERPEAFRAADGVQEIGYCWYQITDDDAGAEALPKISGCKERETIATRLFKLGSKIGGGAVDLFDKTTERASSFPADPITFLKFLVSVPVMAGILCARSNSWRGWTEFQWDGMSV